MKPARIHGKDGVSGPWGNDDGGERSHDMCHVPKKEGAEGRRAERWVSTLDLITTSRTGIRGHKTPSLRLTNERKVEQNWREKSLDLGRQIMEAALHTSRLNLKSALPSILSL